MQAILLLVVILAASGLVNVVGSSVLVADLAMTRMVELNAAAPFCALHHDRGVIQRMVLGSDPKKVRQISNNLVADLEETCKASRSKGKNQSPGGGIMYPGTKWCGPGNIAKSYDDLGHHAVEDACCREHDHCSKTIGPRQCIHGICNSSPFTRSHCDCDAKFRRCLQTINTEVANTLGALFFNVIQVTCFKERRPCSQWQRFLEVGHTQSDGDSMHAMIEKSSKNKSIFTQSEWCKIMREAKVNNGYEVQEVDQEDIFNLAAFSNFFNWTSVKIASLREIAISPNQNFINVKYDFNKNSNKINIFKKRTDLEFVRQYSLTKAYNAKLPLSDRKEKDLQLMLNKNLIPINDRYFYENIFKK